MNNMYNTEYVGQMIEWNPNDYDPATHGAIVAMRIFLDIRATPMAELVFAVDRKTFICPWNDLAMRKIFNQGITAYTLVYDERTIGTTFTQQCISDCNQLHTVNTDANENPAVFHIPDEFDFISLEVGCAKDLGFVYHAKKDEANDRYIVTLSRFPYKWSIPIDRMKEHLWNRSFVMKT